MSSRRTVPPTGSGPSDVRPTVLVVDDDEAVRRLLTTVLRRTYSVEAAGNGTDAVECLRRRRYDLVISDNSMPGLNGVDVFRTVLQWSDVERSPFMFFTSFLDAEEQLLLEQHGVPFLLKSTSLRQLQETVAQVISPPRAP